MKSINLKKLILPNLPYLLFVFLFDKVGQAVAAHARWQTARVPCQI